MSGCARKRELALVQMRLRLLNFRWMSVLNIELISHELVFNKIKIIKKSNIFKLQND